MGLWDIFRSKKTAEERARERAAEKQDRTKTLTGVERMLAIAEKMERNQAVISAEVEKIKTQQVELHQIFATKELVIKGSFFLFPRKKRGQIRLTVSPKEFINKILEIMKVSNNDAKPK